MADPLRLRELSEMTAPERAFLSVYLADHRSLDTLDRKLKKIRSALKSGGEDERSEREHFDENVRMIREYLDDYDWDRGRSLCLQACWALDFLYALPLPRPVDDLVRVDSSPYIRPLAEFDEEYEKTAVVAADNDSARVFLLASAKRTAGETVEGNVKNHVKKGGWSQQRYERRRDNELQHYAAEIAERLRELDEREDLHHLLLVGSRETIRAIEEELTDQLREKCAEKALDLGESRSEINEEIFELLQDEERQDEHDLWETIRTEVLREQLGVCGLEEVLEAVKIGRADSVLVERDYRPAGRRCRDCEHLQISEADRCDNCGSESVYPVDVVEEIVELCEQTSADVDFCDPIEGLAECGRIAALLRWVQ